MVCGMNIDFLISAASDPLLGRADWFAFNNWDALSRMLDAVIPNAWSNYRT